MASFRDQFSLFLVLLLFFSPQIHARQGSFFSKFMRYNYVNHVDVTEPNEPLSPVAAPSLAPALTPEPVEITPAPTPAVADRGDAYGLYGRDSSRFSQTQETPAAVNNEFFNEELVGYKTGYPKTNLYSSHDSNPTHYNDNGYYTNNYNNDQNRRDDSDNSGYPNNYKGYSYSNNYKGYSYPKVYYKNEFYNNRVNGHKSYKSNGYQDSEKQGMSDTRFVENGKYYYDVKGENDSVSVYDESSGKESIQVGEGYNDNNKSPYEFDSMEEYEKQQGSQEYVP